MKPLFVKLVKLVDINEYKRRQAPVGPRITSRNFGKIVAIRSQAVLVAITGNSRIIR